MGNKLRDEDLNLNIIVNGDDAKKELGDLEAANRKLTASNKELRAEKDKLKRAGKEETEQYKEITRQINENSKAVSGNDKRMAELRKQIGITGLTMRQLKQEAEILRRTMANMVPGTDDYKKAADRLKLLDLRIREVNTGMKATHFSMGKLADGFNKYFSLATAGIAVFTGVVFSLQQWTKGLIDLDDALADVMKTTGLTRREAREMYTDFRFMNTRTPRKELLLLAEEAGRLGKTSKKDIADFVEVANKIKVALGDDLGGEADVALREVGKLTEIFKVGEKYGTDFKTSMEKIGSGINTVANNSNASAGYLIEYMKRLGGVSVQAKIGAADIMGYAATLDQLGQNVEMAATAQSKLIVDMFTDPAKYAKIAKMEVSEFSKLLKTDANEAFIKFLEGLNGNNEGLAVMATKLDGLGIDGARAVQVLAALSSNTKMVRDQQTLANKAMEDGTSLSNEYNIKNNNLAGSMAKIGQVIRSKFVNSGLISFLENAIAKTAEWIEQPVEAKLQEEQRELNTLIAAISNVNTTQENRNDLIAELQKTYPDFLQNLDAEKVTNEQLKTRLEDVNKQYEDRILLMIKEDMLTKNYRERTELKLKELDLLKQIAATEKITGAAKLKITPTLAPNDYRTVLTPTELEAMNRLPILTDALARNRDQVIELKQSEAELNAAIADLHIARTPSGNSGGGNGGDGGNGGGGGNGTGGGGTGTPGAAATSDKFAGYLKPADEGEIDNFAITQAEKEAEIFAEKKRTQKEWTAFYKAQLEEQTAAALEQLDKDKEIENARKELKMATLDAFGKIAGSLAAMAKEGSKAQIAALVVEKGAAIAQIIWNTFIANSKARVMFPPTGLPWTLINSAVAAANIATIVGTTVTDFKDKKNNNKPGYAAGKYPGLRTGMYGDEPHYALFNEVPGQPEMVVDGLTTRRLRFNYPDILRAIYQVRDGKSPQYAEGKYPSATGSLPSASDPAIIAKLDEMITRIEKIQPRVAVETIEKEREKYIQIKQTSGL